jgi:hypothetical protein
MVETEMHTEFWFKNLKEAVELGLEWGEWYWNGKTLLCELVLQNVGHFILLCLLSPLS